MLIFYFLHVYSILKVGVACMDDAHYLLHDYSLSCVGCVDLRHLVPRTIPSARSFVIFFTSAIFSGFVIRQDHVQQNCMGTFLAFSVRQ